MSSTDVTVDRLANAFYETEPGRDGYPPSHVHMSWREYCVACVVPNLYVKRAEAVLRMLNLKDDS